MKSLLFTMAVLFSIPGLAQNPLFDNEWYLTKIIMDGMDTFPPLNSEVTSIALNFTNEQQAGGVIETNVCNVGSGTITLLDNAQFTLDFFAITLMLCNLPESMFFESYYLGSFYQQNTEGTFSYIIVEFETSKTLYITAPNNLQAVYSNQLLSKHENSAFKNLKVYPVPARDFLNIETADNEMPLTQIGIVNALGQVVLKLDASASGLNKIDLQSLSKGIYYLKLQSGPTGNVVKIAKE
ncbi:MAG TPA: T9SS type A sorting domain-containing protein [Flavobacterium sp.]|jgi:hypothetical protein